jgi:hypothetical protein
MAEVMDERSHAICLEPPGDEGEGVEFVLRQEGRQEYWQVKRQQTDKGRWMIDDLSANGVLVSARTKLRDPSAQYVFASTHAAFEIEELADRARRASSWSKFESESLTADAQKRPFEKLGRALTGCGDQELFDFLRRFHVRTVDETSLKKQVESLLCPLVEGDAVVAIDSLAQLALENVNRELIAPDIWSLLEQRGFRRRNWGADPHVLEKVNAANARFELSHRRELIGGRLIPRLEAQTAAEELTHEMSKSVLLLSGPSGVGKSGVLLAMVDHFRGLQWPMLSFRVDRLTPEPTPAAVGRQLGLPGEPAAVLASVAQKRDCLLVIDQLDAVSLASGRNPPFFDCIYEILRSAQAHPKMRVLLACRTFDLENDYRLRELTGKKGVADVVNIGPLDAETTRREAASIGLDSRRLDDRQLYLLSMPIHLKLLSEIVDPQNPSVPTFATTKELFDLYWDRKQNVIRTHHGDSVRWTEVIDALATWLSDHQVLSAPLTILDQFDADAKHLASENVIVRDGDRYAFFHQSFFDYAFARRFAATGQNVLSLLRSGEQTLFRRSQVRQIILHERETSASFQTYLSDLMSVLTAPDVRLHIKDMVFAFLAELADPTEAEWQLAEELASTQDEFLARAARNLPYRARSWFKLVDSLGLVQRWLSDDKEQVISYAVDLLWNIGRGAPDRVAELLEPYIGKSDDWNKRIVWLLQFADFSSGRKLFDLLLRLTDMGLLDDMRDGVTGQRDYWSSLYTLSKQQPVWTCEAVRHYFERHLKLTTDRGQTNPFDTTVPEGQSADHVLTESAQRAPEEFVAEVLPFMLEVMRLTAGTEGRPPREDPVWGFRMVGHSMSISEALLAAMEEALGRLSLQDPDAFHGAVTQLRDCGYETAQYLLMKGYAANGQRFADEAADCLCENPAMMESGYSDNENWVARGLLAAITPHCGAERLTKLEQIILSYYPRWEKSKHGIADRGKAQLVLLDGIDPRRRSEAVLARFGELKRKFPEAKVEPPSGIQVYRVGSPVPDKASDKMTDAQWLSAMRRYHDEDSHEYRDRVPVGGAHELSGLLETQVKKQPSRFAELACVLPDDIHPYYYDAILRGIEGGGLAVDVVLRVCRRCHALPGRPCGRWIHRPVAELAEKPLPDELLDVVAWYATDDPDPNRELWRTSPVNRIVYHGGSITSAGINSARGTAAESVARLIFSDASRLVRLRPALDRMVRDPSIAVRSCVASAVTAVLKHDPKLAVELFLRLIDTEDVLLSTRHVERFLYYALHDNYGALEPVLQRMLRSEVREVVRSGARQACLAGLTQTDAEPLARLCLAGDVQQRLGVADVVAANIKNSGCRPFCVEALKSLFNDQNEDVRRSAARCFDHLRDADLGEFEELIELLAASPAFGTTPDNAIWALEETTAQIPDIMCEVCERFLAHFGNAAADLRQRAALNAQQISKLVFHVYGQSDNDAGLRKRCLDVIDRMVELGGFDVTDAMDVAVR